MELERAEKKHADERAGEAEIAALRAEAAAKQAQIDALDRSMARMWLEAEAERAWGPDWRSRDAPAVAVGVPAVEGELMEGVTGLLV
eukprot:1465954-Prymnesium_polylepis.1